MIFFCAVAATTAVTVVTAKAMVQADEEKYGLENSIMPCFFERRRAIFFMKILFKGCFQQSFSIYNHYYLHENLSLIHSLSKCQKKTNANRQLASLCFRSCSHSLALCVHRFESRRRVFFCFVFCVLVVNIDVDNKMLAKHGLRYWGNFPV